MNNSVTRLLFKRLLTLQLCHHFDIIPHRDQSFDCVQMQQPQNETANNFIPSIQLLWSTDPPQIRPDGTYPQAVELFPCFKDKWNTKEEILNIILAANADPKSNCVTVQSSPRPCSSSQFIYPRLDNAWYKNDGYIWKKRTNGKQNREDHLNLKISGHPHISAKYIHSAIVPTFHRRSYSVPDSDCHVLVHYLNVKTNNKIDDQAEEIARSMIENKVFISLSQLHDQLSPIFLQTLNVNQLVAEINEHLKKKGVNLPTSPLPQEPSSSTSRELERRNSCSSAFRKGLSSVALRRQPSANSEIDANHIGTMLKRFGCNGSSSDRISIIQPTMQNFQSIRSHQNHVAMESRSPSGDGDSRPITFEEDASYQQLSIKSSTNVSTPASAFAEKMKIRSGSQESPMGPPSSSSVTSTSLIPIIEMTPSSSSLKGGQKMLVVGGYYRKGHEYKISFGRGRMMPAVLIHAGVLSCVIPPSAKPEVVQIRVFCNGQAISTASEFTYEPQSAHLIKENDDTLVQIFEKIRIMACAFNAYSSIENIQSSSCMESLLANIVQQIDNEVSSQNLNYKTELLNGSAHFPSKTVLHLVASLDYDRLFEALIDLSRKVPACREFDIFARDNDGSTPLHTACKNSASRIARLIISIDSSAIDVVDDRGRTPVEVAPEHSIDMLSDKNNEEERVNATELWVMTNGKAFTTDKILDGKISRAPIAEKPDDLLREATSSYSIMSEMYEGPMLQAGTSRECDEDCESCCDPDSTQQLHVEIAMDTDVHVPDSPKMARLFHAVTSPGIVVPPNARARMADLARQIIEALPDRIKRNSEVSMCPDEEDPGQNHHGGVEPMFYQQASCSMSTDSPNMMDDYFDMMATETRNDIFTEPRSTETTETSASKSAQLFATHCNFFDDRSFASSSTRANTFESDTLDFDKDLGEFFTIHVDRFVDPIQQRLANLKYNDDEQRDVYEAAMVIQRAYRVYRARSTTRRQEDIERRAALKIQGCYRRYKQFCYFKKLHNAAIVVQKHFRMRKRDDKEEGAVEAVIASVPEHPTLDGQSICIQVPKTNSTMLRERAATTIQVAYRYRHRKRQAAARKIQNFMRQNRNKLRKMHALNEDGTSPARKPAEINATNEILMVNGKEMLTTMPQNSFRSVQHHPQQQFHIDQHNVIIHGTN
ncbi:Calmodulin-binding transcription activator homolog 1 [Caenorhabditis elegans]|uniref:Isoform b of Calmodulin-binding transcription activator homolog 1 n=1 Tax=Caenorhabditis elegans TaxID=6239 RepID=H2KY84-2|nr:Calmodulin-binding transcription activator homolog 1 [Caenorhabditis elegans]CCD61746.1 Calmodulin-binding transcription activator homolog 1 [Caenorhabditis elegans]|eukprot:NP_494796.2 CAMTA (CAlModulin-binding Transcriptional activator) [Caenorhabditis elegans]